MRKRDVKDFVELNRLVEVPKPFEMDLPWGEYGFSRRFYDIVHFWGIPTAKEVSFIQGYLKSKDDHILDLTCGGGRHALGLAEAGYNKITAIDIGGYPIELAEKVASKKGISINLLAGDIKKIDYKSEFELVYLICGQIAYFSPDDVRIIFKNVSRALVDGGIFIIHLPSFTEEDMSDLNQWYWEKRPFYFDHPSIVHREQYYFRDQRIRLIRDFAVDTVTRKNRLFGVSEKNYTQEELEDFGHHVNIKLLEKFGDYNKNPLTDRSSNQIYIFTKK